MKKLCLCVAFLALGACSTPKYVLTTSLKDHQGSSSMGGQVSHSAYTGYSATGPTHTYHYYSETKDSSLKPLLIPVQTVEDEGFKEFKSFVYLCNKGKFGKAREILDQQEFKNSEVEIYLESLFLFMKKKNEASLEKLTTAKPNLIPLHFELLKLDIQYEINKGPDLDKPYFIQKYQEIIDIYELNEIQSDLIKTRIKYLRYS
ncbi:hypothetical protein SAMN04488034_101237 [Salinimicrobium catena]|uniref:Lipoprotein n=1 Tax=Salinimicrobium catena TaxID=390640 RepID=A0A1H5HUV7_9FLAO|nr:hypothetical protein [Salinimicrobium catena]SDK72421.1 hypothetical protein SAMN04488140_101237 [Salinimicrobium catena]SEE31018.1 hypothetical protein SAMN04488034_101237 [Salinimicrobium catena]